MADTLSIRDNRTGQQYEVLISDGTIRAADLKQIAVDDEPGLATYDPGFVNTASCRSSITYIDGDAGILEYRGYPIEQLAESSTFWRSPTCCCTASFRHRINWTAGCMRSRTTRSCTRTSSSSSRVSATTHIRWAC